jgi:malonyl-CoA decarboxylase
MTLLQKISQVRSLSRAINGAKKILTERGEANSASMANDILSQYRLLSEEQKISFYHTLATKFNPDPSEVLKLAQAYAQDPSGKNLIQLTRVTEPPRQALLRRINRVDGGTKEIVAMRRHLIKILDKQPDLKALDYDLHHLFVSWFNPGFLKMHRVDWRSPAHILEKIIQHEAVHEIDGWDDLRRRLQPDRRCFAFFHPQLPDEPLIFVEVALVPEISDAIGPLVNKKSETVDSSQFKAAIFYSISNCEPGLKGVSLGNFLIKRVATYLKNEFPSLKTFVTLSPIPGFMDWVINGASLGESYDDQVVLKKVSQYLEQIDLKKQSWPERLSSGWHPDKATDVEKNALIGLCAIYLAKFSVRKGGNPVAKFHLGNGAQLYRINWAGDLSKKGLRQSASLMVNYLYDLDKIEDNHERFVNGEVIYSRLVTKIL